MKIAIEEIIHSIDGKCVNNTVFSYAITDIYFDTRKGAAGNHGLFIAIDGKNADGHDYIEIAYQKLGTRNFLISKAIDIKAYPQANFIVVRNVIEALQKIAIRHRSKFNLKTIGITGSNGKTMVKEWIFQLCSDQFNIVRSPGSYNSQIGVPLSILKINTEHELGIFEAGISSEGEMNNLAKIIQPEIGIFTNIGEAHSAGFTSLKEKVAEKAKLMSSCEKIIYCIDHLEIAQVLASLPSHHITWSAQGRSATYAVDFSGYEITINQSRFTIPFKDEISRQNAVFAIILALELGLEHIPTEELETIKMRIEMKQGINNSLLINDAYNSDIFSLATALKILEQQQNRSRNTLILSQIEESNLSDNEMVAYITTLLDKIQVHRLITVGKQLKTLTFKGERHHFDHTEKLLQAFESLHFENENVLIKGARKFNLEKLFEKLSIKVHQTILEIDLEAMRHNLMIFRSLLEKETKLMVVLKASGYGSGSKELSRFLAYQRVDYIAVAYIDEGIELRKSGISVPIMVMNPEESGFHKMISYDLEPEIYSMRQLQNFTSYVKKGPYAVHLKIETGMHRLGFSTETVLELGQFLADNQHLKVASVFSHLVGSDTPELDYFSLAQLERFTTFYNGLIQYLKYKPIRHMLNSNGISRFPQFQFEMVRLGIGLHGLSDDAKMQDQLQKVQTLKTRIAQIKWVQPGETIGYNRTFEVKNPMRIGTINIGYADGLPRAAGNEKYSVLVNGKSECRILGNICMDMCMIDLSEIEADEGDEVIIFGKNWPIERLAAVCNTIPYEILTRISSRVHRIFSRE